MYRSPLLDLPGAAEARDADATVDSAGVAWHYGNPLGEQRLVETTTVVVDRSHRQVIRVDGPDAPGFLNNLLSQKLDDVADGFSASALDLDIQGRILHHTDVTRVGDAFYLDLPASQAPTFVDFLRKMVFWSQVEVTETDLGVLTLLGGDVAVPEEVSAVFVRTVEWPGTARRDVVVERARLDVAVDALLAAGAALAGLMAFTAERVRALEPEKDVDLDHKSIPHEVSAWIGRGDRFGAVHLEKGCYRGQETVARVENLGRSPRLLVMLHLDGSAPEAPAPGSALTFNGRTVGRLGTVVHDCDFGPIALGLVKRSALDSGELMAGEVAVSVDPSSIPEDEGEKAGRAAIDRLRGR
ncbi:YgfZ/GcvT domain-containing protein [Corynebacterium halotolerans]|uniref:Aminomethyltransferase n=1 Tax=Corynebacterium halotolerans YIM 70093 = DSM 44683 TaxID=1121362 RepID=M1P9L7_9CORY|nr:folate-binding protein YgfZ [Corynebacterium halotolerans]AGF73366.1 aminomethyltransferase [Corynebacterium halotolerans YIM 70093 = DSM 44683]